MQEIHPSEVKFDSRIRKNMGDINSLALSIKKSGQIQPIVVTQDLELIAGGRRLAACLLLDQPVKYVTMNELSDLQRKVIELEENIARKEFTPAEECCAITELHNLKCKENFNWTLSNTADLLSVTKTTVFRALEIAEHVELNPQLRGAKTKHEITAAVKSDQRLLQRALDVGSRKISDTQIHSIVKQQSAVDFLKGFDNKSVDLILTDPPYGIDVDKTVKGIKNTAAAGYSFSDTEAEAQEHYALIAKEGFRVVNSKGKALVFCAPSMFSEIVSLFKAVGWLVYPRPIVWIKGTTGQTNNPDKWPAACYEIALYARKPDATFEKSAMPDWVGVAPIKSEKAHPTEKPAELIQHFINYLAHPKSIIIDPYAGSFVTVEVALKNGHNGYGCDISNQAHIVGLDRISKLMEEMK